MKILLMSFLILLILSACQSNDGFEVGTSFKTLQENYRRPDSIVKMPSLPDAYTNKWIEMEQWYFGNDTIIYFANQKIQSVQIKKNKL